MSLFLTRSEQGTVVFHILKNLGYSTRLLLSLIFILAGFYVQYVMFHFFPGILLVLAGNLLLLVKGYDNRIKLGTFKADAEWVGTDAGHLGKLIEFQKKIRKWDLSAFDITSVPGVILLLLSLALLGILVIIHPFHSLMAVLILVANLAVLIYPHWFTGIKRITTVPAVIQKIKLFLDLTEAFKTILEEDEVKYLILLKGKDQKLPADVKMKIKLRNQPDAFLGLYGQVSMNNVQGQDYPYFYVVLVSKETAGMIKNHLREIKLPENVISEFSHQEDAEILVIRQYTTNKSGYHTDARAIHTIFGAGLTVASEIVR